MTNDIKPDGYRVKHKDKDIESWVYRTWGAAVNAIIFLADEPKEKIDIDQPGLSPDVIAAMIEEAGWVIEEVCFSTTPPMSEEEAIARGHNYSMVNLLPHGTLTELHLQGLIRLGYMQAWRDITGGGM